MTFNEWINTEHGKKCSDIDILINPEHVEYFHNRLYHAFEAGLNSHSGVDRLQLTIEWYERKLVELTKENKRLKRVIKGSAKLANPNQITETD